MMQGSLKRFGAISYGIVVHGGVGSPLRLSDGCKKACSSAFKLLKRGSDALEAVVEAARLLEDDGRFNAGSGSTLRLDGATVEMDAGLMDSSERLGIVISVRNVRNPILLARAMMETPHVALAGHGAELFARRRGLKPFGKPSKHSRERYRRLLRTIRQGDLGKHDPRWQDCDIRSLWNFEAPYRDIIGTDTIGAVALDKGGNLAVANSTGGASPMLLGRVGDSPLIGCGFYAGSSAAVACTGIGEEIIKRMLAKTVYDFIVHGEPAREACRNGIRPFPGNTPVGIIAISKTGCAIVSNRQMAHHALIEEG
jgi:L-asparaginase/beta-aspartyl-peptidase (threonine type)